MDRKKLLNRLIIAFCAAAFLFSAVMLCRELLKYKEGDDIYRNLAAVAGQQVRKPASSVPSSSSSPGPQLPPSLGEGWVPDFAQLRQINPDIFGWIQLEGTELSYPLVQAADNDRYISHAADGTPTKSGAIFLDYRQPTDFTEKNSLIYGHNLLDGKMFGLIGQMAKHKSFKGGQRLFIATGTTLYTLRIYSAYATTDTSASYTMGEAGYAAFLDFTLKSGFLTGASTPALTDRVVTLSTCTNREAEGRYAVHAYIENTAPLNGL